jgi:UDP-galactopyranose mutase
MTARASITPFAAERNVVVTLSAARRRSDDCRYHLDPWQGSPAEGYTKMFGAMLGGMPLRLERTADAWRKHRWDHLVFTGSIADYFGTRLGRQEYRLDFRVEEEAKRLHFQLNEHNRVNPWTRSVDHSHWLDQDVERTVAGYEFPCEWEPGRVRMYPKSFGENPERYRRYRQMAEAEREVTFVGRLATYKYLDMDDVVAQVMTKIPLRRDGKKAAV